MDKWFVGLKEKKKRTKKEQPTKKKMIIYFKNCCVERNKSYQYISPLPTTLGSYTKGKTMRSFI